jgi:4-hydroxybenzoate polyprenyltransferase
MAADQHGVPESMSLAARLGDYAKLTRLDKPIGTLLLLWPTLWALWTATDGHPHPSIVAIFCLGTLLMRSAGCAVNDFADRDFDPHVERTRHRPLAARRISSREALVVAAVLSAAAFLLIQGLNALTRWLSVLALAIAATYPFTKRFFAIPQAYLGIAFGFGIPMAYAAETGSVPAIAWCLVLANVTWAIAYDTEYAMVDRNDDVRLGIHTSALLFGRHDVAAVMASYAATLAILAGVGVRTRYGPWYFAGLAAAAAISLYHYTLIADRSRAGCFRAFRHNNWFGAAVFVGLAIDRFAATGA